MYILNETHDPALRSWVESANTGTSDFPLQNLPFAVFRRSTSQEAFRGGVAIGDQILDLAATAASGALQGLAQQAALAGGGDSLNALMALNKHCMETDPVIQEKEDDRWRSTRLFSSGNCP